MVKLNGQLAGAAQTFHRSASLLHVVSKNHRLSRVIFTLVTFCGASVAWVVGGEVKRAFLGDCPSHNVFSSCDYSESLVK